jgi:tRNA(Ile)-lysidine synthase
MVEQFIRYINEKTLFTASQRILLAVSGGADSMLMLNLFLKTGYSIAVAHCNFGLRGEESKLDEEFVGDFCDLNNIIFHIKHFNTSEYALQEGISIEMAARQLRYDWFNELLTTHSYDYLATAHHQDDAIETFLINLARGSGIRGLSGIRVKSGRIIRPLLFTGRTEILKYCKEMGIQYRTDSSNAEVIFKRNLVRHEIIPMLEQVNAGFRKNALRTIENLNETALLFNHQLDRIKLDVFSEDDQGAMIRIDKLMTYHPLKTILFELIHPFGFQSEQIESILHSLDKESGRKFFSKDYLMVKDRDYLLISPIDQNWGEQIYIEENCCELKIPLKLSFQILDGLKGFKHSTQLTIADFDFDRLNFPLKLRHWNEGEYFYPLGMKGMKKLSDFFIDEKYSIPDKDAAWILSSGNEVVWIVGKRIDDRFKVTPLTNKVFRINLKN